MSELQMFIPLTKVDAARRLVYGVVTAEAPDRGDEICDFATTKPYYQKWSEEFHKASGGKSLGSLRAMHGRVAAGRLEAIHFDDDAKQIEICAKVVDDAEWKKVEAGVYTGFSQGGAYVKRWPDPQDPKFTRYTADPIEISLVDMPCLPSATFTMVKADGKVEAIGFVSADLANLVEQVWRTQDGGTFKKKADALAHQAAMANAGAAFGALAKIEQDLDRRRKAPRWERVRKSLEQDVFDAKRAIAAITIVFETLLGELAEETPDEAKIAALDDAVARLQDFVFTQLKSQGAPAPQAPDADETHEAATAGGATTQDDLARVVAERDLHKATLDALTPRLEKLAARIEEIGRQPLPPPLLSNARIADKGLEAPQGDLAQTLAAMTADERAALLIKVAQRRPATLR